MPTPDHSFVIPVYNEEESLRELHAELIEAASQLKGTSEILYVNDGSTDDSPRVIDELAKAQDNVHALHLSRNMGKSAVYMHGFSRAGGAVIFTLDSDLQDDPAEVPAMLDKLNAGHDLVVGWKQGRAGNEFKKAMPSRLYNLLKGLAFGLRLHDSNCGFRAMTREVAQQYRLYGDLYRFMPELAHVEGARVTEIAVNHRPRKYGKTKYGPRRFWTGLLDILSVRFITGYRHKPLHFFGSLGLLPLLLGVGLELYVLYCKLTGDSFATHIAAIIIGVMFFLLGVQLISTGLIAEMIRDHSAVPDASAIRRRTTDRRP